MPATLTISFRLHRTQQAFRRSAALYRGFVGGRGAGKTFVGAYDLIRRAKPGRTYLVASPTGVILHDTTFPTFEAIARQLHAWPRAAGVKLSPYPTVRLTNGATVRFRTAEDPERMRGPNLSGVWLDEASLMPHEAFTISIAALREAGEQGWLSATFTPKGLGHWTYDLFGKGKPDTELFTARTSQNPFNPAGFSKTLRQQYTERQARQELGGEFVDMEGAEWPGSYFHDGIWFDDWPRDLTLRVIALDPSKGKDAKSGDYSALVSLGRCKAGTLWVDCDAKQGRPTPQIVADALEFARRFQLDAGGALDAFAVESNAFQFLLADEIARASREAGVMLPVRLLDNRVNKLVRIRRLGPYLERGNVRVRKTPGGELLVAQLRDFPLAKHDDAPDACEMALRTAIDVYNGRAKGRTGR